MKMVRKFLTAIILILVLCRVMIPSFAEIEGETIFGDLEGFDIVEGSDGIPLTLGTTFAVRVPGKITAVRMYTGEAESGVYVVELWDVETKEHIAGPFDWEIESGTTGWRIFELPSPVEIEADKDYMVSVRNNSSSLVYQMVLGYFESIDSSDSVFNLENSYGAYSSDLNLFPEGRNQVTYPAFLRDVVFVPEVDEPEPTTEPETNPSTGDGSWSFILLGVFVALASAAVVVVSRGRKVEG
jgi:LPXTG-motif cell wall-anchored protein